MNNLFSPILAREFWQGDCLELMRDIPDGSVDMICTDPPYGMSFQSNHRKERHNKIENDSSLEWIEDFTNEMFRVAKNNSAHYSFCSFHHVDKFKIAFEKKFTVKNILIWEKNNTSMGDLYGDFAPKYEMCFLLHKGRALIRGKRDPNIFKFARTRNELHPTQKPVDLMEYLISKFSDPGDVILDPFAGSGTTAIAALNTGRGYICIEKDPEYYKLATERVREYNG